MMKAFGLFLFCAVAFADTVCGPSYEKLVDPRGNALPLETPFIASVEIAPKTAMVFRPVETDIRTLVTRLEKDGVRDPQMLTVAYWQERQCRIVNDRCTGECPIKDGKKLRCIASRDPGDPAPPPGDHKKGKKGHSKNDGKPSSFAAHVASVRCQCQ